MSAFSASLHQAGVQALKAGRLQEALADFQNAVKSDPDCYESWTYLGMAASKMGDFDLALRAFGNSIRIHPESAKARYNMACAQQMAGDLDAARVCLEGALALDPDYAAAREALEKIPKPREMTMSELAGGGTHVRLPGAHRAEVGDDASVTDHGIPVSHLTPQEIARLAVPEGGHIHMMGAQATDVEDGPKR
jgi:tetratricopeptide (TPR) repeat protein